MTRTKFQYPLCLISLQSPHSVVGLQGSTGRGLQLIRLLEGKTPDQMLGTLETLLTGCCRIERCYPGHVGQYAQRGLAD